MAIDIDGLQIEINQNSEKAVAGIDKLTGSLSKLKASTKGGVGLKTPAKQIGNFNVALNSLGPHSEKLNKLADSLAKIKASTKGGVGLGATAKQIVSFNDALAQLQVPRRKLKKLVQAFKPLEELRSLNINSTLNSLKKIPKIAHDLSSLDMNQFEVQMRRAADAIRPLSTEMQKVSNGFQAFPSRIQRVITQNERLASSGKKAKSGLQQMAWGANLFWLKLTGAVYMLDRVSRSVSGFVAESNNYVENLNLFSVSMGRYTNEALEYAKRVQEIMGIDMSEWIRNQGIFMQIATGFGVVKDKAYQMSKGLTKISYDIASFFNIPIEEAFRKVESGIAGELEPLRRLGYALDVATLKQIALDHGINQNINTMTQAQKSQLRYLAIMKQSSNVMGDMSRTLVTPANAMRVLGQQATQLKRAIGDVLVPVLMIGIPYLQAFVKATADAIRALAKMLGFELPKIDYSGLSGINAGAENIAENAEDAAGAMKKLKDITAGFDELNVISPNKGGSTGSDILGGSDLDVNLKDYDFIGKAQSKLSKMAEDLKAPFKEILASVGAIGLGLAGWKVATEVVGFMNTLKENPVLKKGLGIAIGITGLTFVYDAVRNMTEKEKIGLWDALKAGIGSALGIAGSLLTFGTGTLGWTIGIGAVALTAAISFKLANDKKAVEAEIKARFGDISFTDKEIKDLVDIILPSDIIHPLSIAVQANTQLENTKTQLTNDITELETSLRKVSLGVQIPKEKLKTELDNMVVNGQRYLDEAKYSYSLAIKFFFGDKKEGVDLENSISGLYVGSKEKLNEIGAKIKQTISEGFVNGEWIPDKLKEVQKLQEEAQKVLNGFKDLQFKAKVKRLSLDLKDAYKNMDYDSIKRLKKELKETVESKTKDIKAEAEIAIEAAIKERDANLAKGMLESEAKRIYDQRIKIIQNTMAEQEAKINLTGISFDSGAILTAFDDVIEKTTPIFQRRLGDMWENVYGDSMFSIQKVFEDAKTKNTMGDAAGILFNSLETEMKFSLSKINITPEILTILNDITDDFSPTIDQLKKINASGQQLPEELRQGITNDARLKALKNDTQAIYFLMGKQFGTHPDFLKILSEIEKSGQKVPEAIKLGIEFAKSKAVNAGETMINETSEKIKSTIDAESPVLNGKASKMGSDLSIYLKDGTYQQQQYLEQYYDEWSQIPADIFRKKNEITSDGTSPLWLGFGKSMPQFLQEGTNFNIKQMLDFYENTWKEPANQFKKVNEIGAGGGSAVWKNFGAGMGNDLTTGLDNSIKEDTFKGIFGRISNVATGIFSSISRGLSDLVSQFNNAKFEKPDVDVPSPSPSKPSGIKKPSGPSRMSKPPRSSGNTKRGAADPKTGKIKWYASGGFPSTGEMFVAREAGPELVGNIGSRAAVANNDQIVAAVSKGVYEAVVSAMSGNRGDSSVNIYMDSEEISRHVKKDKSGYPVMGGSAFGY